jgi:hypothetical protein
MGRRTVDLAQGSTRQRDRVQDGRARQDGPDEPEELRDRAGAPAEDDGDDDEQ